MLLIAQNGMVLHTLLVIGTSAHVIQGRKGSYEFNFLTCMRDEYKGYQFVIFAPSTSSFLSINNLGTEVFCLEIEHVKKNFYTLVYDVRSL
jgi:hypothetical protein